MHSTKTPKNNTLESAGGAAQLDLFYDSSAHAVALAGVSAISVDQSRDEHALQLHHLGEQLPENTQLDLFINTPFDQALNALRRALLNNEITQAIQFYQTATELDAARRRPDSDPSTSALSDAHICLQLLQTEENCKNPRAVWLRLGAQNAALQRFFGPEATRMLHKLWRRLAACPELEVFDPTQAKAYAAQIWFDLDEPELANQILECDPNSVHCPLRLHLWAQVAAALEKNQSTQPQNALRYWQALCFDWPVHAEECISQYPKFNAAWAAFCDLEEPQDISSFPGFAALHNFFSWPLPDRNDTRPDAELIRIAHALNANHASVPLRLTLKALNPALFQDWMTRRSRAS